MIVEGLGEAISVFSSQCLILHDREMLNDGGTLLGVCLDGVLLQSRPDAERWLRCRAAISFVLIRRRCSGAQMEILMGHLTFLALSSCEVLCVFYRTYRFIQWS